MPSKSMKTLLELSNEELDKKLKELRFELAKSSGSKSSSRSRQIKRTIARILTLKNSKK